MKNKKMKLQLNKETIANLNEQQMSRINGGNGEDSGGYQYPDDLMMDGVLVGGNLYNIVLENGEELMTEAAITASISTCHISQFTCCTGPACDCKTITKPKRIADM